MKWKHLSLVALTQQLVLPVSGYGTTISIAVSYCPATYSSSSTTTSASSAPSSGSPTPYFLFLANSLGGQPEYVAPDGTISTDPRLAVPFTITPSGQLISGNGYVSTSGEVPSQRFEVSPVLAELATVFSISTNNTLVWMNDAFAGRQAIFCAFGSVVQVIFNGIAPAGCTVTQVNVVPSAAVTPSSMSSMSMTRSSSLDVGTGSGQMPTTTSTVLATSMTSVSNSLAASTSVSSNSMTGTSSFAHSSTTRASMYSSQGQQVPSSTPTTTTALSFPTTTGVPNCFDRSPFDGTINDNYLVLCDTELPGYDLEAVPANDIADCIDACNAYGPGSEGPCIAVEFDILASANPCHLKFDINVVNRGANAFAQAAIVVNQPYAPHIEFADSGSSPSDTSITGASSIMGTSTTTSTVATSSTVIVSSSTPSSLTTSSATNGNHPTSIQTTTQQTSSSLSGGSSPSITTASSAATTSTVDPQQSSSATSSSLGTSPLTSSTTVLPTTSSTVNPSSGLQSTTSSRTTTTSTTTSTSRLSTSQTTPYTPTSVSSTTSTSTSPTSVSYCSSTPTTTALCPSYNHQALNVNSDGVCYEVECSTTLQGSILSGNSTTASTLKACIGFCTLYNVALPYGCVGVNYLGTSSGSLPNCILLSSITGTSYSPGIDSGRLLYAGYPSIADPVFSSMETTTSQTVQTATTTTGSRVTSSTSTTSYSPLSCAPAPSASACPGTSPTCYDYNIYGSNVNYEVECGTSFTGSSIQPLLAFSLEDCIMWCQYQNLLQPNSCIGLTFQEGSVGQGTSNNCYRYSSLTCATRGNSTFDSARMLYSGYPRMTDYSDPNFVCGAAASSTSTTTRTVTSTTTIAPASSSTSASTAGTSSRASTTTSAASTTSDLSQASSTLFPRAYPQDPVCNNNLISKYEGGQALVNPSQGRYYDIECAADYTNPGNNPFGATTQATYNGCANQCDVAAAGGTFCAAFSWTASSGLCTLFGRVSNGQAGTTNMTNTAGTHSGRYLYNSGTGPELQLYLSKPVPFPTGQNVQGATVPAFPGGTNTYYNGWAQNSHTTPLDLSASYGINWRIFDQVQPQRFVSANFWFTNTPLTLNSQTQNTWSVGGRNNDAAPISFPASNLPEYTLAPFWTVGYILGAGQQGIYYQVDTIDDGSSSGTGVPRYGVSIEWYFSHYTQDNAIQHAITTYDTGVPGVWTTYFFATGSASQDNGGLRQTVGGQGSSSSSSQFFNYCRGQAGCVGAGGKLVFDTTLFDASQVANYTAGYFTPANVAPGSWSWSTIPTGT
ncbi:hypothetical protein HRR83_007313 [Exophiala dermatitidis]|uniref:DUF7908 domain-containing protein n=2 Tax=Exophiala dermatitidis TaxID=5970 RepID=H6C3V9_EXODN|nr:uncharacterized protein HMPREF1120_06336 [Exophiala dermatitidis NIH/UT8656]KAJ4511271.1 hypothetical protein HRR73_006604 [Exophiala dermatitidis]EHY58324.1 hypothetical protein HMPREF1120_06336 [Exophiala dermatitidis NIH/UT8656]KAJ4534650.1 hypothetical protein HRR76_006566 [Exophiala dermatitidis]KAJ4551003.1 hypothetical protein HRR77_003352 [Exophiala dermatitidis]KAJ4560746.1 hypothetical protein HRR79_007599 [Exophiala dermatitidis]